MLDQQVPDTQPGRSGRRLAGIKRDERSRNGDGARYVRRPNHEFTTAKGTTLNHTRPGFLAVLQHQLRIKRQRLQEILRGPSMLTQEDDDRC